MLTVHSTPTPGGHLGEATDANHGSRSQPTLSPAQQSDSLVLSAAAQRILDRKQPDQTDSEKPVEGSGHDEQTQLTDEEKAQVTELQRVDREVRAHEQAHASTDGQHVSGGISYEYQVGPDGKNYAVAGEVHIDSGPAATPEATIAKAQQVRAAALAPADPSSADLQVAAKATQMLAEATRELRQQPTEENGTGKEHQGTAETYNRSGISSFDQELGAALDVYS